MSEWESVSWGLLPEQVHSIVHKREWSSFSSIKKRLSGKKSFPIEIGLKPPSGTEGLKDILHLQAFISQWKEFPDQHLLEKESRNYRDIGAQMVPKRLIISSIKELINYLGPAAVQQSQSWEEKISLFLDVDRCLSSACIAELQTLDIMPLNDVHLVVSVLKQIRRGMGKGRYLRALPLTGVHTKVVETYEVLIERCLDLLHDEEVSRQGGLRSWLDCRSKPNGWLLVSPLCRKTQQALGGISILKMSQQHLASFEFCCEHVLVVENEESGLSLPELPNTIAVFGGGASVAWMSNPILKSIQVYYWGDIDSHGLKFLNDARSNCGNIKSTMMDRDTCIRFEERMTTDSIYRGELPYLNEEERRLFLDLQAGTYLNTRLEQELLSQDYINSTLTNVFKA